MVRSKKTKEQIRRRNNRLIGVILFLIGLSIFLYPSVSEWLAHYNQVEAMQTYIDTTQNLTDIDISTEWARAEDYNRRLVASPVQDPFADTEGIDPFDEYYDTLNINGVMGYIKIPKIDVALPIYHGVGEQALSRGVGHIKQTALPVGGENTHSVLTGHTGLPSAKLFTDLTKLEIGDEFYIYVLDKKLTYQVDQIEVVLPEDISKLVPVPGQDYITLVTCTPYGINDHRLLVRGTHTATGPAQPDTVLPVIKAQISLWWIVLIIILIIVTGVWLYLRIMDEHDRRKARRKYLKEHPEAAT